MVTNYAPNSPLDGNTAILLDQSQTLGVIPQVTSVSWAGGIATFNLASDCRGSLGSDGDSFNGWTTGFAPGAWNVGATFIGGNKTFTVVPGGMSLTCAITSNPGTATSLGIINTNAIIYAPGTFEGGIFGPPGVVQFQGTNTFGMNLNDTYGLGPLLQMQYLYQLATPIADTWSLTNSSNVISKTGYPAAGITQGMQIQGTHISNSPITTVSSISYIVSGAGAGTTQITMSQAATGGGSQSLTFGACQMFASEQIVIEPLIVNNSAGVQAFYPTATGSSNEPGAGQNWQVNISTGGLFYSLGTGSSLSNIQMVDLICSPAFGSNTQVNQRWGIYLADSGGNGNGVVDKQVGMMVGKVQTDGVTFFPWVGAQQNLGIVNASTTFYPTGVMATYVDTGSAGVALSSYTFGSPGTLHVQQVSTSPLIYGTANFNTNTTTVPTSATIATINTAGVMTVASTAGWPQTGQGCVVDNANGYHAFTYDAITATTFTGVTIVGSGTLGTNAPVNPVLVIALGAPSSIVSYTGVSANTFTGCVLVSGSGTLVGPVAGLVSGTNVFSGTTAQCVGSAFTVDARFTTAVNVTAASSVSALTTGVTIIGVNSTFSGQQFHIVNGSAAGVNLTFTSGATTQLLLGAPTRVVSPGGSLTLVYKVSLNGWVELGYNPGQNTSFYGGVVPNGYVYDGTPAHGLVSTTVASGLQNVSMFGNATDQYPKILVGQDGYLLGLLAGGGGAGALDTALVRSAANTWATDASGGGTGIIKTATDTSGIAAVTAVTGTPLTNLLTTAGTQLSTTTDVNLFVDITGGATGVSVKMGPAATPTGTLWSGLTVTTTSPLPSIPVPKGWYVAIVGSGLVVTANAVPC